MICFRIKKFPINGGDSVTLHQFSFYLHLITMSLEEKFNSACDQARKFSKKPPDSEMLEIYALYKQATVGDCNTAKPVDATGKAKWEAWNSKQGLDSKEAKEQYVGKIKDLAPTYA